MTVEKAIEELQKVKDKTVEIYTDCPNCGRANAISTFDLVVVVRAGRDQKI